MGLKFEKEVMIKFIFSVLIFVYFPTAVALQTKVFLTNNTPKHLDLLVNGMQQQIQPYETKNVLQITRDGTWSPGVIDNFEIEIQNAKYPEQVLRYRLERTSEFLSSKIKSYFQLPFEKENEFLKKDYIVERINNLWSENTHFYAREYLPIGHIYDDIQLVVDESCENFQRTESPNELTVLNYNIQMLPFYTEVVDKLNQPKERAKLIPARIKTYDIVVVEELFDKYLREEFISLMSAEYPCRLYLWPFRNRFRTQNTTLAQAGIEKLTFSNEFLCAI